MIDRDTLVARIMKKRKCTADVLRHIYSIYPIQEEDLAAKWGHFYPGTQEWLRQIATELEAYLPPQAGIMTDAGWNGDDLDAE